MAAWWGFAGGTYGAATPLALIMADVWVYGEEGGGRSNSRKGDVLVSGREVVEKFVLSR